MRTVFSRLVGTAAAATVFLVLGAAQADALTVKEASWSGGLVTVSGGQATRSAAISWEGVEITTAGKGGGFSFTTDVVPADCVGTLSDGTSTIDVTITGCAHPRVFLPGTGQTISYEPGDDGEMQIGGALDYTDNGDGTLTDNGSGLTWEKKTDANVNEVYPWSGALAYVAALNAMNGGQGFAGHNDWRLPNVRELQTILDYSRTKPMIHPAFGPTMGILNFVDFWSSTSWVSDYYAPKFNAWGVDFLDGGRLAFGKTSALRVRAVRGGK
jgi:hypothetical protein